MIFNKIKKLKEDGLKVGITFSTFDLLHAGHIAMLAEAKNHCDYLIAGLQTDPTIDRPDTKKDLYKLKFLLDEILDSSPEFAGEAEFLEEQSKKQMWRRLNEL